MASRLFRTLPIDLRLYYRWFGPGFWLRRNICFTLLPADKSAADRLAPSLFAPQHLEVSPQRKISMHRIKERFNKSCGKQLKDVSLLLVLMKGDLLKKHCLGRKAHCKGIYEDKEKKIERPVESTGNDQVDCINKSGKGY